MQRRNSLWLNIILNGLTLNGYEGLYKINKQGDVYIMKKLRAKEGIKKPSIDKDGYKQVNLSKNGKCTTYKVHRLVALTFIPNPNNYPVINHIDGNKQNNKVDNLEWCTRSENDLHAFRLGLRKSIPVEKKARGERTRTAKLREYEVIYIKQHKDIDTSILMKEFNVSRSTINSIKENRNWRWLACE